MGCHGRRAATSKKPLTPRTSFAPLSHASEERGNRWQRLWGHNIVVSGLIARGGHDGVVSLRERVVKVQGQRSMECGEKVDILDGILAQKGDQVKDILITLLIAT